jgi:hypothetical protein
MRRAMERFMVPMRDSRTEEALMNLVRHAKSPTSEKSRLVGALNLSRAPFKARRKSPRISFTM